MAEQDRLRWLLARKTELSGRSPLAEAQAELAALAADEGKIVAYALQCRTKLAETEAALEQHGFAHERCRQEHRSLERHA